MVIVKDSAKRPLRPGRPADTKLLQGQPCRPLLIRVHDVRHISNRTGLTLPIHQPDLNHTPHTLSFGVRHRVNLPQKPPPR